MAAGWIIKLAILQLNIESLGKTTFHIGGCGGSYL
jgi:hypothetical protein